MRGLISIGILPEDQKRIEPHQHSHFEIVYYTRGEGRLSVGDQVYPFREGDIACVSRGIVHGESSERGFRDIFLSVEEMDLAELAVARFRDDAARSFRTILHQLLLEYHLRKRNWRQITEALLSVLSQYLIAWRTETKKSTYVESLENVLAANIGTKGFRASDGLKAIPVSTDHMRRLFKTETGVTPGEYLNRLRINHARNLLRSGSFRVKDVAALVGIADPYYFSRLFKSHTGMSPSEWAERDSD